MLAKGALCNIRLMHLTTTLKRFICTKVIKLTDIGEGIHSVRLVEWYVKKGDIVKEFDSLAEVQSDKASVEISSKYSGKVSKLCAAVGDNVLVGDAICEIETDE